jgi:hypothetical protein
LDSEEQGTLNPGLQKSMEAKSRDSEEQGTLNPGIQKSRMH